MRAQQYILRIQETLEIDDDRLDKMVSLALERFPDSGGFPEQENGTKQAKTIILDVIRDAGFDKDEVKDVDVKFQSEKEPGTGFFDLSSKVLQVNLSGSDTQKFETIGTMAHELYHAIQVKKDPNYVRKEKDANRDTVLDDLEIDPYSYTIALNFLPYLRKSEIKMLLRDILHTAVPNRNDEVLLPLAGTLLKKFQLDDHERLVSYVRFLLRRNYNTNAFKEFIEKVSDHYDKFSGLYQGELSYQK
jgi:hypothetical protein